MVKTKDKVCKIYYPLMTWMCRNGYSKHLALFCSIKVIHESGHIWDWKTVNVSHTTVRTRRTYEKYLRVLEQLKLIRADGRGGFVTIGQNAIMKMFPADKGQSKFFYLYGDIQLLRSKIEQIILEQNINAQARKIQALDSNKVNAEKEQIIKTVCGKDKLYLEEVERNTTRITCRNLSALLGFSNKSGMTGLKREWKWDKEKFIEVIGRRLLHGRLSPQRLRDLVSKGLHVYRSTQTGLCYEIRANEINIRSGGIGKKKIGKADKALKGYGKRSFVNNELFQELW